MVRLAARINVKCNDLTSRSAPSIALAEQRAAIVTVGRVEDVTILVVQARAAKDANVLHGRRAGRRVLVRARVARRVDILDKEDLTAAGIEHRLALPRAMQRGGFVRQSMHLSFWLW